ncbi:hypothetical protein OAM91_04115 [Gammaproteobacteria bacterium]|nr:hypothetical protein [Gammaproteobacteria bacterium]
MELFQFFIITVLAAFFVTDTGMELMTDFIGWLTDKVVYEPKNKITKCLGAIFIGLPLMALTILLTFGLQFASAIWIILMLGDFIIMPIWENAKDFFGWY